MLSTEKTGIEYHKNKCFLVKKYPPQDLRVDEQMLAAELTIAPVVLSNEIQYSDIFTIINNSIAALLKQLPIHRVLLHCTSLLGKHYGPRTGSDTS